MKRIRNGGFGGAVIFHILFLAIFLCLFSAVSFAAEEGFPKKEITIIVPLAPGGSRDITSRAVGNTMSKYLGAPVVIRNMSGAGGALGITNLYNSPPDGYTIGIAATTEVILQIVQKVSFDLKKFTYIGKVERVAPGFFVRSESPFHTFQDFKTFGKPVRVGTHSYTANSLMAAIVIAERLGFPLVVVGGYKGGADAVLGLVRGEVEFAAPSVMGGVQLARAGTIRPIMVLDRKRSGHFPNTPTVGEAGWPELEGFATDLWFIAPPAVPKDRLRILEEALMKTLKDPEFLKWAKEASLELDPMGSQETTKSVSDLFEVLEKYKKVFEKYKEK
jgi:tripartite-type tricarboxylate transporter receptor subunit TctC